MIRQIVTAVGMLLAVALPSFSAMLFTLNNSPFSAYAGDTVIFLGTITPDTGADIFLNGISYTYNGGAGAYLTGDLATFTNNVPGLFLTTDSPYTGPVFSIAIDPLTPVGTYTGTVTLRGGADQFADSAIVSAPFEVDVLAPEPGSIGLGLAGIAVVAAVRFRTRTISRQSIR